MDLKNMMIVDGVPVKIDGERNLLEVIRKIGIELPVFCYNSDLSIYGACRMCMVEDERGRLQAACSTAPQEGMVIKTNTARLRKYRRTILELLLAEHCRDCTICPKSGQCKLQDLAHQFGLKDIRFNRTHPDTQQDTSSYSIVRNPDKCILCGDCVRMCNEIQHVGAIDFAFRSSKARVSTAFGIPLSQSECVGCGQCAAVCPTGALTVHQNVNEVWKALDDPKTFVTCEIAPAVRVGIGKELGLEVGHNSIGLIVAALHRMGFDQVYDTSTSADLTVMEEAAEFVDREKNGGTLPLFTSCCPAWVNFVEKKYPEFLPNVSTCRSPMSMFASTIKEYYRDKLPEGKTRHVHVALMPCTAKKFEAKRVQFRDADGTQQTDIVITTQELIRMIRESGLNFADLQQESIDLPFGTLSGAGVIFGVTGGVTEAVLRRVADDNSRTTLQEISYTGVRGMKGVKEASIMYGGKELKIAVASGLGNADTLLQKLKAGEVQYDLVEVMACPGGCIAGGGQPYTTFANKEKRGEGLYRADRKNSIRCSQDNPLMQELYDTVLKGKVHELLHVDYLHKAE